MLERDLNATGSSAVSSNTEQAANTNLIENATVSALELRSARAKFLTVVQAAIASIEAPFYKVISEAVGYWQKESWLSKLILSLGDPTQLHFAVHIELAAPSDQVIEAVQRAWTDLFEIETRPCWGNGTLLSLRPKGGREATLEDMRPALPADICEGKRVYIMHGDFEVLFEHIITDVSDANADYKGFTANDGCRYGLDGSVFILNIDDNRLR